MVGPCAMGARTISASLAGYARATDRARRNVVGVPGRCDPGADRVRCPGRHGDVSHRHPAVERSDHAAGSDEWARREVRAARPDPRPGQRGDHPWWHGGHAEGPRRRRARRRGAVWARPARGCETGRGSRGRRASASCSASAGHVASRRRQRDGIVVGGLWLSPKAIVRREVRRLPPPTSRRCSGYEPRDIARPSGPPSDAPSRLGSTQSVDAAVCRARARAPVQGGNGGAGPPAPPDRDGGRHWDLDHGRPSLGRLSSISRRRRSTRRPR